MTMLGRVLAARQEADLSAFADGDQVSEWAMPYVQTLVALGIVQGSGGRLNPGAGITRGEAAKLLVEVYGLDKAELTPRPSQTEQNPGTVDPNGPFVNPTERENPPKQGGGSSTQPGDPFFDPLKWKLDWPIFDQTE